MRCRHSSQGRARSATRSCASARSRWPSAFAPPLDKDLGVCTCLPPRCNEASVPCAPPSRRGNCRTMCDVSSPPGKLLGYRQLYLKKKGVQGEHSPRAASTGLIRAAGKREPEGGTVGSFLEGAGAAAPPPFEAKPVQLGPSTGSGRTGLKL